jgi:cardiolipin synthase
MIVTTVMLRDYMSYIYSALTILGVLVLIAIINAEGNPAFKMTWMLLVLAFPAAGSVFYVYMQISPDTRVMRKRLSSERVETETYLRQDGRVLDAIWASRSANAGLAHFLYKQVGFPTYRNTSVRYFSSGEEKIKVLLEELAKAKKFIFLEYFIIAFGDVWDSVLEILKEKARSGVEVRVLYDGTCSVNLLPYRYPKELEKYGIICKQSNPLKPFLSTVQNNRDHRKIVVIDGNVAFTGGVNLADEYVNITHPFGYWKDAAIMICGDAVVSFTMMFLQMWYVGDKKSGAYRRYSHGSDLPVKNGFGYVTPYGDSPLDNENVGEEVYFHILNHAKKYVHIMTPYLVLDNEMITTLTRVAKSGIDVSIILPSVPDKWYVFYLGKTYYSELISSGVRIYEYKPGFVHAKVFVSDDDTATVGSVNLDFRSLYLHFECGVFIYNNPEIKRIEADFQNTLKSCEKISIMEVHTRSLFSKIVGRVLRLFAPLM